MSRPGALVLVTTSFPIRHDGSEAAGSFVSDLVEELARNIQVRVVAPGCTSAREPWSQGVEVFRYPAPDEPLSNLKLWRVSDLVVIRNVLDAGAEATLRAVESGVTNHILALWALPSGHWARRASRSTGIPYSAWTLGSDIWSLGRIPIVRSHLRRVLQQARNVYSDGRRLAEETRRIARREVEFLPSTRRIGQNTRGALRTAPPYRLLYLGRWHHNKGVDILLDALSLLGDEDWRRVSTVEICGGGPLQPIVERGVAMLKAAGRPVELRGFLDKAAAEEAILRADYLVIPSRIESIPVVFSDAVKLHCPVVTTPVGDLKELVEAEPPCGFVSDDASPSALAAALSRALRHSPSEFLPGLGRATRLFDLGSVAACLLQLVRP